ATARAARRAARTQMRMMASAARELRYLAAAMEHTAAARAGFADRPPRSRERNLSRTWAWKGREREEMWEKQQQVLRQQQVRMHEAHEAARRAKAEAAAAAAAAEAQARDAAAERRIDTMVARYRALERGQ